VNLVDSGRIIMVCIRLLERSALNLSGFIKLLTCSEADSFICQRFEGIHLNVCLTDRTFENIGDRKHAVSGLYAYLNERPIRLDMRNHLVRTLGA
jgi:hypothetical protein